jgi:hypothetical protein
MSFCVTSLNSFNKLLLELRRSVTNLLLEHVVKTPLLDLLGV